MKLEQGAPEQSKADDTEKENDRNMDATLSFLNGLPEVPKLKPERSVLDEHLAFLDSLPKASSDTGAVDPVVEPKPMRKTEASGHVAPRKGKKRAVVKRTVERPKATKKKSSQLMKEEKNRREKERAEAKRRERREAEQQQKQVVQEPPPPKPKRKRSFFEKLRGLDSEA